MGLQLHPATSSLARDEGCWPGLGQALLPGGRCAGLAANGGKRGSPGEGGPQDGPPAVRVLGFRAHQLAGNYMCSLFPHKGALSENFRKARVLADLIFFPKLECESQADPA